MVKKSEKPNLKPKRKSMTKVELEEALLTNFVNLQKVLTNLSLKFDDLSDNITKLLQLFEISAKSFAEKYAGGTGSGGDLEMLKKLDSLLDQNKTIAKGIMLMEEKIRNKSATGDIHKKENTDSENQISKPENKYGYRGMIKSKAMREY